MNYIIELNRFWDWATLNPLPTGQIALYMALLHINNKSNWVEWFQAPNQVLSILTGLSRSGILTARNGLKQAGLIDVRERGTKTTLYCVIANSKQVSTQDSKQDSVQDSKRVSKQTEKQSDAQALYINNNSLIKDKNININNNPPISPLEKVEQFFSAYPKSVNFAARKNAEDAYLQTVRSGIPEDDIVKAAENYADACKLNNTQAKFIMHPKNFLKETFLEYLPGQYVQPEPVIKESKSKIDQYNQFMHRDYNTEEMEALERDLLKGE